MRFKDQTIQDPKHLLGYDWHFWRLTLRGCFLSLRIWFSKVFIQIISSRQPKTLGYDWQCLQDLALTKVFKSDLMMWRTTHYLHYVSIASGVKLFENSLASRFLSHGSCWKLIHVPPPMGDPEYPRQQPVLRFSAATRPSPPEPRSSRTCTRRGRCLPWHMVSGSLTLKNWLIDVADL